MIEATLMAALVANIYFIVFCRLAIHASHGDARARPGLMLVMSLPPREGLDTRGLRYWRLYWAGWLALSAWAGLLLWLRYPHIAEAFRQAA